MIALRTLAVLAAEAPRVGSGRIQGGWEYVWAAYGITWAFLLLYTLSLWIRRPRGASRGQS